jgi:hypothetical protein
MPALKSDQVEALSHLPAVIAIITELTELLQLFKKLEQSEIEFSASQYRKYREDLREAEREKVLAIKEAQDKGFTEGRGETKFLTSFLKYASHRRANQSHDSLENDAAEAVLLGVYQGGEAGALVARKLADGSKEHVDENNEESFTCTSSDCNSNV